MRQARSYDGDGSRDAFAAAMRQANVTLTLTAKITPGAATETVWGLLPGSGPDHERGLIVNTHTDARTYPRRTAHWACWRSRVISPGVRAAATCTS
jgi:hypothetical protein